MSGREWKIGDKLYRHKFDVKAKGIEVDVFTLKEIANGWGSFEIDNPNLRKVMVQRLDDELLERVRTKGTIKYVITRSGDDAEAAKKLRSYILAQIKRHEATLAGLNNMWDWIDNALEAPRKKR